MLYFFVPLLILALLFIILAKLYGVERGFLFLCLIPVVISLLSFIYERQKGVDVLSSLIWAVSFEASIILVIAGTVLIIRAIVLRRGIVKMLLATFLASLPMVGLALLVARSSI